MANAIRQNVIILIRPIQTIYKKNNLPGTWSTYIKVIKLCYDNIDLNKLVPEEMPQSHSVDIYENTGFIISSKIDKWIHQLHKYNFLIFQPNTIIIINNNPIIVAFIFSVKNSLFISYSPDTIFTEIFILFSVFFGFSPSFFARYNWLFGTDE